ncbi:MAG TPA: hypothetical protein VG389_02310 [Myxococcota bacterium]|jgi:hypothetical protein|nr:hypothetical protein [Myxococcota bacterium]
MGHLQVLRRAAAWLPWLLPLAAGATGASCGSPPLNPPDSTPQPAGIITGTATIRVVDSMGQPVDLQGDLYLLLFPQPPSPAGGCFDTGSSLVAPLNLLRIGREEIFRDPGSTTHSVDFVIPQVPPGCYSIGALVDADGDFYPLFGVSAGATAGDGLGGAFVEPIPDPPATPELRVIEIEAPEVAEGLVPPVEGVQVFVGAAAPFERPSFVLGAGPPPTIDTISVQPPGMTTPPTVVSITATPLMYPFANTSDPVAMTAPFFYIVLGPDLDGDFVPEDGNGDMVPDIYVKPTILFRRLSDNLPDHPECATDPTQAVCDAPWDADEDFPLLLPGVIDPTNLIMDFANLYMMPPDGMTPLVATELFVVVPPIGFLPPLPGAAPDLVPLAQWQADAAGDPSLSPVGRYGVTVILPGTNQTWSVPNELMVLVPDPAQGASFSVTD